MTQWEKALEHAYIAASDAHDNWLRLASEADIAAEPPIEYAKRYVQAALNTLKAHGYVVVPVEPTEVMEIYGGSNRDPDDYMDPWNTYTAMIKAAQQEMEG